jgi:hypothetical protein
MVSTRAIIRTVRIRGVACGIIADMVRVIAGLAVSSLIASWYEHAPAITVTN